MNSFIRIFYFILVRPWLKFIIGVKFENRKIVKTANQYIIVANHNSHFDTVSIMAALPASKLKNTRAVAADGYFGKTSLAKKATQLFFNAILINRNRKPEDASPIEILDTHLKNKESLILFPEGSRGEPGVINDFKKGIAILLKENPTIPFIPVYLDGFGRVLPKDKKLIIPLLCKVRFGNPLHPKSNSIEGILDEVKDAIFSLKKEDERDNNQFEY